MHSTILRQLYLLLAVSGAGCAAIASEPQLGAESRPTTVVGAPPASALVSSTPAGTAEATPSGDTPSVPPTPQSFGASEPYEFPSGLLVAAEFKQPASGVPADTTVLHIGDSFAGALGIELNKVFKEHGVKGHLRFKVPSYIPGWASGKELPEYLAKYEPDLVLVTLGANEMEIGDPALRAPTVRKLVQRIGDTPCVWIAPALWGKDNGLLEVVRENVAPCRFLDTNAIVQRMPRAGDKIHPHMNARPDWAELVLRWLARERVGSADKPWALRPEAGALD